MQNTQEFCREFRRNTLKMTLQDVEHKTGTNIKTVWAFENGKSSNINHLKIYMKLCSTLEHRRIFINGISKAVLLDGDLNNDLCNSNNEQ